ncbi:hypothetical protein [Arthrobacter woluwensis]|uniref:Uncharacterized protein n=1 Tax=Arthrobacter woluwensis TaxID=156980 RepID=A0A1H4I6C1_9MICC|nr:hypothetical protein [Arthrobacter woluwensis]SEB29644.1 hypothetical protein SAMN04489745_0068 [Arthrobacter woluwensis]
MSTEKQPGQTYRAVCHQHPELDFPVRADRIDAVEDKNSHLRQPGSHHVAVLTVDLPPSEVEGFPPAGYARQLFSELERYLHPEPRLHDGGEPASHPVLEWSPIGIVPTFTDGKSYSWIIDGRIHLEASRNMPYEAWAEFESPRSRNRARYLATFAPCANREPWFEIWRLSEPDAAGNRTASKLDSAVAGRAVSTTGGSAGLLEFWDREARSPLIIMLQAREQARSDARAEADRQARSADPLIDVVDRLAEAATDYAAAAEVNDEEVLGSEAQRIRKLIGEISPGDLAEVLFRITVSYGETCMLIPEDD